MVQEYRTGTEMKWVQHGARVPHWNGNEMGSTWCKSTALEQK